MRPNPPLRERRTENTPRTWLPSESVGRRRSSLRSPEPSRRLSRPIDHVPFVCWRNVRSSPTTPIRWSGFLRGFQFCSDRSPGIGVEEFGSRSRFGGMRRCHDQGRWRGQIFAGVGVRRSCNRTSRHLLLYAL